MIFNNPITAQLLRLCGESSERCVTLLKRMSRSGVTGIIIKDWVDDNGEKRRAEETHPLHVAHGVFETAVVKLKEQLKAGEWTLNR